MSKSFQHEETVFAEALTRPDPERPGFLAQACHDDPALRARVEELLEAHQRAEGFLDAPPLAELKAPCDEKPGDRIGRYKLLQQIGEGGYGTVYMAEQETDIRRRVALKVIKLGMDTKEVIARFELERQALALMDHPNIARVLDAGTTNSGRPYFVMELVRGVRINEYCDQQELSTEQRLALFTLVCRAVQHAHQKGIIHRDLKPSNILVTLHDGVAVPKVIDFGIAKATQGRLTDRTLFTQFHAFVGTPAYTSPEQVEFSGLDIDTRSDIYSLGVLLYELLTGRLPLDLASAGRPSLEEIRRMIRELEPARPSQRVSTLSRQERTTLARSRSTDQVHLPLLLRGDLDWIVMKCLEKDRSRRYASADALALDVERHLHHEPVLARPPSTLYRLRKMVRRHRLVFAGAAAIASTLAAGAVVSTWQAVRAKQAEAEARRLLYVANFNRAQQGWDNDQLIPIVQVLGETRGNPNRNFEWYYWERMTHLNERTLYGHQDDIRAVAVSPDGERIATGSSDATARIWDTGTGSEILTLRGHSGRIWSVAFSPDGQRLATASSDQTVRIWDAATGLPTGLVLPGRGSEFSSVRYSPGGGQILTGSLDGMARLWDATTGGQIREFQMPQPGPTITTFSPDGRLVAVGTGGRVVLWDAAGSPVRSIEGYQGGITGLAFSPDGGRLLTTSADETAHLWDTATGRELARLRGHTYNVECGAFSPDGKLVATSSYDSTIRLWDPATGLEIRRLKGHLAAARAIAFTADGQRLVSGGYLDNAVRIWNLGDYHLFQSLAGHTGVVRALAYSPDGRRIATASRDGTAKIWDARDGRELLTLRGHDGPVWCVAFSHDGRWLATGGEDKTCRIWDANSGRARWELRRHTAEVRAVAFAPDDTRLYTGGADRALKAWDLSTGRELMTARDQDPRVIVALALSPDGRRAVTAQADGSATVWDLAKFCALFKFQADSAEFYSVAFSPDGKRVATASFWHGEARIWDARTGMRLQVLRGHNLGLFGVAYSPDGRRLATCSYDKTAKLWDLETGREILTLRGHDKRIMTIAFSPTGRQIATGGNDRTAILHDAATDEQTAIWEPSDRAMQEQLAGASAPGRSSQ
jgi:WD40 repeat protein/serine/threonine protein kinase